MQQVNKVLRGELIPAQTFLQEHSGSQGRPLPSLSELQAQAMLPLESTEPPNPPFQKLATILVFIVFWPLVGLGIAKVLYSAIMAGLLDPSTSRPRLGVLPVYQSSSGCSSGSTEFASGF